MLQYHEVEALEKPFYRNHFIEVIYETGFEVCVVFLAWNEMLRNRCQLLFYYLGLFLLLITGLLDVTDQFVQRLQRLITLNQLSLFELPCTRPVFVPEYDYLDRAAITLSHQISTR